MGTQDERELARKDARRSKTAAQREGKSSRLEQLRKGGGRASVADWGSVDPRLVAGLVSAVTGQGAAVMLALTSDGGALSITIYDNGDRERFYFPVNDLLEGELDQLIGMWLS